MTDYTKQCKAKTIKELQPMLQTAQETGLWFHSVDGQLWFSAKMLQEHMANGRYIYRSLNWVLIDPQLLISSMERKIDLLDRKLEHIRRNVEPA